MFVYTESKTFIQDDNTICASKEKSISDSLCIPVLIMMMIVTIIMVIIIFIIIITIIIIIIITKSLAQAKLSTDTNVRPTFSLR